MSVDGSGRSAAAHVDPSWSRTAIEVADGLATDVERGLRSSEVVERLRRFGPNELDSAGEQPFWRRVGGQFADPLVLLLLAAIGISVLAWWFDGRSGAPVEAAVIAAIVVANAILGVWQEGKAIKAVAELQRLSGTHSTVVRDGREQVVSSRDLVPGDLVVLSQGDAVGADIRLIWQSNLTIGEAALTGESVPVAKAVDALAADTLLAERTNIAHQGTSVTSGRGSGVVVATAMQSEIGRIARLIESADDEPTPLQRQVAWLGRTLGVVVVVLAGLVVATILLTSDVSSFADVVEAALVGVSLAVAAVPEGLPAILSIVLALGVQRMAADRAIVKRLSSVETLGSATVICSDKTGTLTLNQMTIATVVVAGGEVQIATLDPGSDDRLHDGDGSVLDPELAVAVEMAVSAGCIANDATYLNEDHVGRSVFGDPTEIAFLEAAQRLGFGRWPRASFPRVGEFPFDSQRKLMTTINEHSGAGSFAGHGRSLTMFTKGAPDVLIGRCDSEWVAGASRPLTDVRRAALRGQVDDLAGRAYRTLAIAYRPVDELVVVAESAPECRESELTLLGLVGIVDPPRPEAPSAVREARDGGIRVIMITGDHPRTAAAIAADLGIQDATGRVVTGADVSAVDDDGLTQLVAASNVYARVDPEHKLRLVRTLQAQDDIVAMTGDGVNDAPALKQADIGVAMGVGGTEVSKEAADMILADDNFATILTAVREGREIFSDIRKFLRYLLASNTGEVLVVLFGVLFATRLGLAGDADELAVPLLATQILWINLVTDGALALALGVDPAVENVMAQPPRPVTERVIDRNMWAMIAVIGLATAIVSLVALDLGLPGGFIDGSGTVESARTMAFTTLVLAQVFNAFSARSASVSVVVDVFANRLLWAAAAVTVLAQIAVVHVPGLSAAFGTEPLTATRWIICVGLSSLVVGPPEIYKWFVRRVPSRRA